MKAIVVTIIIITCLFSSFSYAAGSYRIYNLPYGISVEIPKGWTILKHNQTRQLDNFTEAITGIHQSNNEILLAAYCYTQYNKPSATFRISIRHKAPDITQHILATITPNELEYLRDDIINVLKEMNKKNYC